MYVLILTMLSFLGKILERFLQNAFEIFSALSWISVKSENFAVLWHGQTKYTHFERFYSWNTDYQVRLSSSYLKYCFVIFDCFVLLIWRFYKFVYAQAKASRNSKVLQVLKLYKISQKVFPRNDNSVEIDT